MGGWGWGVHVTMQAFYRTAHCFCRRLLLSRMCCDLYIQKRPHCRDFPPGWQLTHACFCCATVPSGYCAIVGHSLGGSLATLFALDMAINPICPKRAVAPAPATLDTFGPDVRAAAPATLATFGQPRTGNPAFAAAVDTALTRVKMTAWRVVHHADFAPAAIPRLLGGAHYMHISREVRILLASTYARGGALHGPQSV